MTAVLLAPHNDDETLFASFLILRYRPRVIVCFKSERMHQPDYPGGPLGVTAEERERETAMALYALRLEGVMGESGYQQWPFSDAETAPTGLSAYIALAVANASHVIYPAVEENGNHQHSLISELVERVEPNVDDQQRTRYLTYTTFGRSRSENEVPFEPDWPARKMAALACYRSQISHPATAPHFLDGGLREYLA